MPHKPDSPTSQGAATADAVASVAPKPASRLPAPDELADVALIDAPRIAAAACLSVSTLYAEVKARRAPQPVIRQHRFTRWRLSEVRAWLAARAEQGIDEEAAAAVDRTVRRASAAGQAKRAAARQAGA